MIRPPPASTRTYPLVPLTTRCRSLEPAVGALHPAPHHATSHPPAAAQRSPFGGGRSKTDRPAVTDVHNDFCAFGGRQFDAARLMRLRQKTAIACDLMEATAIVEAEAIESCIGGVQQPEPQALALGLEEQRRGAM